MDFIAYLNDTGESITGYFDVIEINPGFVKIRTKGGIVIIPMNRVLKIKQKEEEND